MRVTKTKSNPSTAEERLTLSLPVGNLVIDLLNLSPSDPEYKKFEKMGFSEELRQEIVGDLLPIIAPEKKLDRKEVRLLLESLVEKINGLNLRSDMEVTRFKRGDPRPRWTSTVRIQGFR